MSNYAKGARLERLARAELQAAGYVILRSAGSKGPVDLVALNQCHVRLIQVKAAGAARPADLFKLRTLPAPRNASRELWVRERGHWRIVKVKP
jgi:Holliday junction resolvase